MTAIIIPRKHYTQPQGRVTIAPEWAELGLVHAWSGATQYDHVNGRFGIAESVSPAIGAVGQGYNFNNSASKIKLSGMQAFSAASSRTYLALFRKDNTSTAHHMLLGGNGDLSNPYLDVNNNKLTVRNNPVGAFNSPGTTIQSGRVYCGAAVCENAYVPFRFFVDGALDGTAGTDSRPAAWNGTFDGWSVGHYGYSSGLPWVGHIYLTAAFARALSDDEAKFVTANPYQIFRADPIRIYSFPSGPIALPTLSGASFASRVPSVTLTY